MYTLCLSNGLEEFCVIRARAPRGAEAGTRNPSKPYLRHKLQDGATAAAGKANYNSRRPQSHEGRREIREKELSFLIPPQRRRRSEKPTMYSSFKKAQDGPIPRKLFPPYANERTSEREGLPSSQCLISPRTSAAAAAELCCKKHSSLPSSLPPPLLKMPKRSYFTTQLPCSTLPPSLTKLVRHAACRHSLMYIFPSLAHPTSAFDD